MLEQPNQSSPYSRLGSWSIVGEFIPAISGMTYHSTMTHFDGDSYVPRSILKLLLKYWTMRVAILERKLKRARHKHDILYMKQFHDDLIGRE